MRLRGAYFITCTGVIKDADGHVSELRCTYDPATRGGDAPDGRKVKATLHWVSATHALDVEVRLYDRLFKREIPDAGGDYLSDLKRQRIRKKLDKERRELGGKSPSPAERQARL